MKAQFVNSGGDDEESLHSTVMGVNHGITGDESLQNSEWGDANANRPPDFAMFHNFKHQITCITMQYKTEPTL